MVDVPNTPARNALILGATGLVGGHCLTMLLDAPEYETVFALLRRTTGIDSNKLVEVTLEADSDSPFRIDAEIDHVFIAFGTTIKKAGNQERMTEIDVDIPFAVAQKAREAGARHLSLVSSLGANAESRIFYNRIKGELEEKLSHLGFESVSFLRPSVIGGERSADSRMGEAIGQRLMSLLPRKWKTIPAEVIASAMIKTALHPEPGVRIIPSEEIWGISQG